jgi:hypothetical protein
MYIQILNNFGKTWASRESVWDASATPSGIERERYLFYYLAMRNTADVTGGKPIAVRSQSISRVNVIKPLVAFHDIHERKREVLFLFFVPDTNETSHDDDEDT